MKKMEKEQLKNPKNESEMKLGRRMINERDKEKAREKRKGKRGIRNKG